MELKLIEFEAYETYEDELKAQAHLTLKQVVDMFDALPTADFSGSTLVEYQRILEQLRAEVKCKLPCKERR